MPTFAMLRPQPMHEKWSSHHFLLMAVTTVAVGEIGRGLRPKGTDGWKRQVRPGLTASLGGAAAAAAGGAGDLVVVRLAVGLALPLVERRARELLLALGADEVLRVPDLAEGGHAPARDDLVAGGAGGLRGLLVAGRAVELVVQLLAVGVELAPAGRAGEVERVELLALEVQDFAVDGLLAARAHVLVPLHLCRRTQSREEGVSQESCERASYRGSSASARRACSRACRTS
jgi:hypothetical protein